METDTTLRGWRHALDVYTDRRVLTILPLGFASGLPLLLTYSTLATWLKVDGISLGAIGAFAAVGTPYAFKFVWSPLIDRLPPPLPFGRRRGWGITIQIALIIAIIALGSCDPANNLELVRALAILVAFLSASQDVVIDAYRVESLTAEEQGPGAALIQAGYRIAMLVSGAGSLVIAQHVSWFAAYATMAALLVVGLVVFILAPEPGASATTRHGPESLRAWIKTAVVDPFADFMRRPIWPVILIFIFGYKLGEALAGRMASPLYIELGFTLDEIAAVSKVFGFFATVGGALLGGIVTAKIGPLRALLICGVLQSVGNLAYVLQAVAGHRVEALALCVAAENLTGGMAAAAMVAYLSSLCSPAFTATQYALLSSVAVVGLNIVGSISGVLAQTMGWVDYFLLTTVITLPALALLPWIARASRNAPT
ncbi:MAG TPA: MFS transporter [Magnetospirillaceae bacterium]|jgi:PAT family beta-lactamase induction signal transducer AmpG